MGEPQIPQLWQAEKVQVQFVSGVTISGQNVFANAVSGARTRLIHGVLIENASGATTYEIDKVPQSGSNTILLKQVPIAAATLVQLPLNGVPDPQKPLFVLSSQENLSVINPGGAGASGSSLNMTFFYWDR